MTKYFYITAIFALCTMAFVSCKPDNVLEPTEPIAVNLRAGNAATRVANNQWQTNDQVGLFMVHTGQALSASSILANANNALMTIENGVLVSNPPVMYPLTGNVDFIAYYPFTASLSNNFTIPVSVADHSTGLPQEILFSNNITNQVPTTNPVTLHFHYSLAKLEVRVIGGANATLTDTDFANITVSIEGMYTQADLQLANGTFANHSEKQTIALYNTGSNATSASFAALILPANEEVTFLFDVGGVVYRHTMTADYVAGNLYRLNFGLDFPAPPQPVATLLNAVIIPRTEHTQDISINAVPYSVLINGIRWATRNVDMPGTFTENPEDFGMFYQWNKRIGWSSTDPLVNSDGGAVWTGWTTGTPTPTGTMWERENDPCPDGWRVPTRTELELLRNAGSTWTENWNNTGIAGLVFGTEPDLIFLPAAGRRCMVSGEFWAGAVGQGNYWGSNPSFSLLFSNFMPHITGTGHLNGKLVRCVEDVYIPVESVTLNTSSLTLDAGETARLTATVFPANATSRHITWTSSNSGVASAISNIMGMDVNGVIHPTGVRGGTTTITATTECGSTATATVTVELKEFSNVSSSLDGVVIDGVRWATRNVDMPGTFTENPEDYGMFYQWNSLLGWSSTDPLVNSDGGTMWSQGNVVTGVWHRRNDPCPEGWRMPTEEELRSLNEAGSSWGTLDGVLGRLFGTAPNQIFLPAAGSRQPWNGQLENRENFVVANYWSNNYRFHLLFNQGVRSGSAWGQAGWGFSIRCVEGDIYIPVESVTLNPSVLTLDTGEQATLTATVLPANATSAGYYITWRSSNPQVATVDADGTVVGVSIGIAVITATTTCGIVATSTVAVGDDNIAPIPLTADMLSTNAQEPLQGSITNLIDGNRNTFFHTRWSGGGFPDAMHYFQVTLDAPVSGTIVYEFFTRNDTGQGDVQVMQVEASNDGINWTEIAVHDFRPAGVGTAYLQVPGQQITAPAIELPRAYSMLRFTPLATRSRDPLVNWWFNMSGFYLFEVRDN